MKYAIHAYDNETKKRIAFYNIDILGHHLDTYEEAKETVAEWKHLDVFDGNDIDYEIVELDDDNGEEDENGDAR